MCGRYSLVFEFDVLEGRFRLVGGIQLPLLPRYNIAPTQKVLVITNDGTANHPETMRWGLIPSWAKDPSIGSRLINARAETVAEKPSFRTALRRRRCLIPADGFYEWRKEGSRRIPMRITLKSGEPFAFAGLWESWKNPEGQWVKSCTIITTEPNEVMAPIHNRMPVILLPDVESLWVDPKAEDLTTLVGLLAPYPAEDMEAYQVSTAVNSSKSNVPECIARISPMAWPSPPIGERRRV